MQLVKAREVERRKAIADGKMDDPLVAKRLEDAITIVGTCQHMCPRFERYRRERENNLFEWETVRAVLIVFAPPCSPSLPQIPGTKRVDHRRAVKMYERAAGDKTLPSDLRPPAVLKASLLPPPSPPSPLTWFSRKHSTISSMTSSAVLVSPRPTLLSAIVRVPSATTLQCNTNQAPSPSSVTIVVHDSTSSLSTLSETSPAFQSPLRNSNS